MIDAGTDPPQRGLAPVAPRPAATRSGVAMTIVLLIGLPTLVYYLWICLTFNQGRIVFPSWHMLALVPPPNATSICIIAGWLIFQSLLQIWGPGNWTEGPALADGSRLAYKMNGWFAWWFTWAALAGGVAVGLIRPTILAEELGPLLSTANIFTYLFSFYLFRRGRREPAIGEDTNRNPVRDYWLGTKLNPRIGGFDIKLFCEARPGLIAWAIIDVSLAAKQLELQGTITTPMILVCLFQLWYVTDYFLHEEAVLTTWDIRHERFGFMLCWGDLVWVPFTYTIQAQYLVAHPHDLPWWGTSAIVLLNLAGYVIFRGANLQKHRFRRDPGRPIWGKPASTIATVRGALLLTSGWWGLSRHMNYLGDLLMGLAWCLPCRFDSPLPYFYIVYLTLLLLHRERRDHAACAARYGKDWETYCARVPYRIIPGLY
jgi:protein-S-isoprenylcysteine O-methyltransferase Ste14